MVRQVLFGPGGATEAKQDDIILAVEAPLTLADDAVRTFGVLALAASTAVTGPVTDSVLVTIAPGAKIRLIRNAGHVDPELAVTVFPLITVKIGSTVIFRDKLEAGLPWSETVAFEGAAGEDLTVSINSAATVYFNMRYQVWS